MLWLYLFTNRREEKFMMQKWFSFIGFNVVQIALKVSCQLTTRDCLQLMTFIDLWKTKWTFSTLAAPAKTSRKQVCPYLHILMLISSAFSNKLLLYKFLFILSTYTTNENFLCQNVISQQLLKSFHYNLFTGMKYLSILEWQ